MKRLRERIAMGLSGKKTPFIIFVTILLLILISSCSSVVETRAISSPTEEPTTIPTPAPTPTNTTEPTYTLSGTVFFDYNGSGLQDVAYDMNGESVEEPGIPNVPVCLDHDPYELGIDDNFCIESNEKGFYTFVDLENGNHSLYVVSPSDELAEAFRYVNIWKREVTIEEYTKNIDTTTMNSLESIETCEADSEALVCKYDEETLLVREQHLNDTEVKAIENSIDIRVNGDSEKDVALMQGFLSQNILGFEFDQPYISTFFDHDDNSGDALDWRENTTIDYCRQYSWPINGICDNHFGTDFIAKKGTYVYAASPGSINFADKIGESKHITVEHNTKFLTGYGHLETILVVFGQRIYSGQIIGLVGNTGTFGDHLHFNFHDNTQKVDGVPLGIDPFGSPHNDYPFFWIIAPNPVSFPITHN